MPSPYNVKIGITHVGPLYNHGPRIFENGIDAIVGYNCDHVEIFMTPNYAGAIVSPGGGAYIGQDWGVGHPASNLTQLAQLAPYAYMLAHPNIKRYFLKTWTFANGIGDRWRVFANQDIVMDAEYNEIKALCQHLLTTYAGHGKEFIIQTSETDWSYLGPGFEGRAQPLDPGRAERLTAFLSARIRAVEDSRVGIISTSKVTSAIEGNLVLDHPMHRMHNDCAWRLDPDYIGLTVYEAINDFVNPALTNIQAMQSIKTHMRQIVKNIRRELRNHRGEGLANKPIIIGEYGWPENSFWWLRGDVNLDPYDGVAFIDHMLEVCDELNIPYAVFWQLWCNDERDYAPFGDLRGVVRTDQCVELEGGARTVQGQYLADLLAP